MALEKGKVCFSMIPRQNGGIKIENISMESCSQILEETKRIQDPVQFTDRKQNLKGN